MAVTHRGRRRAARRDDRHPGGKSAESAAEIAQVETLARGALYRRRMAAEYSSLGISSGTVAPSNSHHSGASGGSPSATLP